MTKNALDEKILEIIKELGPQFDSREAYLLVSERVPGHAILDEKQRILTERTRRLLKTARDDSGRRMFENVPDFDEDGNVTHRWAQPRMFGDDDWHACIDQTVRIGESICRKANALTIRANAERNLGRQIPFPWRS